MRDGIDRYKDATDRGAFQIKVGSEGYPPDLETLVNGVDVGGKKMKFLRRIPIDPMTRGTEWELRAMQDDPDSNSWNGENVFDVYTKSAGAGLDGTKYKGLVKSINSESCTVIVVDEKTGKVVWQEWLGDPLKSQP